MENEEFYFKELAKAVTEMKEDYAIHIAYEIIKKRIDPLSAIELGLTEGMTEVGRLYEEEIYFIPEILVCADIMKSVLEVLYPYVKTENIKKKHSVVIGSIEGDTHDIGKNVVALLLSSAGFVVYDLGKDVKAEDFVEKAVKEKADVIALSTLMTTTMDNMGKVIEILKERNIRGQFKVIVGGKPVSMKFARKIGADGYSATAAGALRLVKSLAGELEKNR